MKQVLNKELVKKAMEDLKASGKKVTLVALHAALGNRGSMTTLVQLKAELESANQPANDSEEGLKTFRDVWALAREEGRKHQEAVITDLQSDLKTLVLENERLEGSATAAANQVEEFKHVILDSEAALADAKSLLAKNQEALIQAGKETKTAMEKVAAEQTAHHSTQQELAKAVQKAHALELEVVRFRTLLDAQTARVRK
jgi:chromosome segregation ATPase